MDSQPTGRTLLDDLVVDILQRVETELGLDLSECTGKLDKIERDIRNDWGGERPYIAKTGEAGRRAHSQRDEGIRADHRRGERVALLARRYSISERRVRMIIATK